MKINHGYHHCYQSTDVTLLHDHLSQEKKWTFSLLAFRSPTETWKKNNLVQSVDKGGALEPTTKEMVFSAFEQMDSNNLQALFHMVQNS